jgi:hypothetical protein
MYIMIAPDSKMEIGAPPPAGSSSTIARHAVVRPDLQKAVGELSPRPMRQGTMRYGIAHSSRRIVTFFPFVVGQ